MHRSDIRWQSIEESSQKPIIKIDFDKSKKDIKIETDDLDKHDIMRDSKSLNVVVMII